MGALLPHQNSMPRAAVSAESKLLSPCPAHVYVHVPFCARRCSYCDFSIAVRRVVPAQRFIDAIQAELVTRAIGPSSAAISSVYLGGGTPSKLGVEIGRITNLISTVSGVALGERGEVTVEANPEDITAPTVRAWQAAGVNRVSLGVQSFDDDVLAWMHRTHSARQVAEAVEIIRGEGISNLSLDLIFALPESLDRDWSRDLDLAIGLESGHLSVYGLTVEPHTPLGRWTVRGTVGGSDESRYEAEFMEAHRRLEAAGFLHYEVSNFARPGAQAVHNSAYWSGAPYLGLGPAAHGFDGCRRRWNVRDYSRWLDVVEGGGDPLEGDELLGPKERVAERVYLGLRTSAGLEATDAEFATAARWVEAGWARREGCRLVLSADGWLRMDALASALLGL